MVQVVPREGIEPAVRVEPGARVCIPVLRRTERFEQDGVQLATVGRPERAAHRIALPGDGLAGAGELAQGRDCVSREILQRMGGRQSALVRSMPADELIEPLGRDLDLLPVLVCPVLSHAV